MKFFLISAIFLTSISLSHAEGEAKAPEAQAVNAACAQDSAKAGCGNEKVGTGLLKCLKAYKQANKEYKFSEECKSAMKTMRSAVQAKKANKAN